MGQQFSHQYYYPFTNRYVFCLTSGRVEVLCGDVVIVSESQYLISSSDGDVLHEYPRNEVVRWHRLDR